jgi:hypothetical protein
VNSYGNASGVTTLTWIRTSTAPSAPTITAPASAPQYSNGNTLAINGTCTAGLTVRLSGASSQTVTCTGGGTFAFTVNKTDDGTYNFSVVQTNSVGTSPAATTSWVRDTVAPPAQTLATPTVNPYTSAAGTVVLSGSCEVAATMTLGGAESGSMTCPATGA